MIAFTKIYVNNAELQKCACRIWGSGLILLLMLLNGRQSFGQRVYANTEQHSPTQILLLLTLSQVINPNGAVGSNQNDSSDLSVTVGLNLGVLKVGTAYQNLQFTGTNTPFPNSPVYFRITGNGGAVLSLLGNFSAQRTIGGKNNFVGDPYTGSSLLSLLGLFAGGNQTYMFMPPNTTNPQAFDGIQLTLNANGLSVGVGANAYVYYSFFITTPKISADTATLCQNALPASLTLTLGNTGDPGITYYLFTDTTGLHYSPGNPLNTTAAGYIGTFSNHQITFSNPFLGMATGSQTQDIFIIAEDMSESPKFFYSGWKKITFKRNILPVPGQATVGIQ